jgi:hypothetical protein
MDPRKRTRISPQMFTKSMGIKYLYIYTFLKQRSQDLALAIVRMLKTNLVPRVPPWQKLAITVQIFILCYSVPYLFFARERRVHK